MILVVAADGRQQDLLDDLLRERIACDRTGIAKQERCFQINTTPCLLVVVFDDRYVRGAAADIHGHQPHMRFGSFPATEEFNPILALVVETANFRINERELRSNGFVQIHDEFRALATVVHEPLVGEMSQGKDVDRALPFVAIDA